MLLTLEQAINEIQSGKLLHIAAEEPLLRRLPKGNWVGGTTPYFIDDQGGVVSHDMLYVDAIDCAAGFKIATYDADTILKVAEDAPANGFTLMIIPFGCKALGIYSRKAPDIEGIFMKNILGWVSGFDLNAAGNTAKTADGTTGGIYEDRAVALHVAIPDDKLALIGIINIFTPDKSSPEICFLSDGTEAEYCIVEGKKISFAQYITGNGINTRLPLVANYNGTNVNTSIKEIVNGVVHFYAPVFKEQKYRFSNSVAFYEQEFANQLEGFKDRRPIFSCNCILNFLYGGLEGKKTTPFSGAVTFGEIAYQLLNQTLVYLEIV
jgi:hypothetical protein